MPCYRLGHSKIPGVLVWNRIYPGDGPSSTSVPQASQVSEWSSDAMGSCLTAIPVPTQSNSWPRQCRCRLSQSKSFGDRWELVIVFWWSLHVVVWLMWLNLYSVSCSFAHCSLLCIYVVNQPVKVDIWTKDYAFVRKGPTWQLISWSVSIFSCCNYVCIQVVAVFFCAPSISLVRDGRICRLNRYHMSSSHDRVKSRGSHMIAAVEQL